VQRNRLIRKLGSGTFTVTVLQPPVVTLTVTGGTVDPKTGVATISGMLECRRDGAPVSGAFLYGSISQRVGRALISSGFGTMYDPTPLACSSPAAAWTYKTGPANGLFVAGHAEVRVSAGASITQVNVVTTIKITGHQ